LVLSLVASILGSFCKPKPLTPRYSSLQERFKTVFGVVVIIVLGCLILPLVMRYVLTLLAAIMEQKTAAKLHLLQIPFLRMKKMMHFDK
jgi:hypothetical protein